MKEKVVTCQLRLGVSRGKRRKHEKATVSRKWWATNDEKHSFATFTREKQQIMQQMGIDKT